jgi:hypothetical protein
MSYSRVLLLLLGLLAPLTAQADLLFKTNWDNQAFIGPSSKTRVDAPLNKEVADDFDLVARIDKVTVNGYRDFNSRQNPAVYGAWVRFYAWNAGKPGALQAQHWLPKGDPRLVFDPVMPSVVQFTLPTPFNATGKHFVSMQMEMDDGTFQWSWLSANTNNPIGATAHIRDNLAGGTWASARNSDGVFSLDGVLTAPSRIDALSSTTSALSGRIRVLGTNFGGSQGNSRVLVGGMPAWVVWWSNQEIHCYVPENAPLGSTSVTVQTATGTSNASPLTVTQRIQQGRVRWRFQAQGMHILHRSGIGPDGSIYVNDALGYLYGLTPSGGIKWIKRPLSIGGDGPVAVGADNTVYIAVMSTVIAFNGADGSEKWRFTDPNSPQGVLAGPNIGPDGNLYVVNEFGLGLFSLTPQGTLRWNRGTFAERGQLGKEIVFGSGQLYFSDQQSTISPQGRFFAYTLGGSQAWVLTGVLGQAAVAPDGTVHIGNSAYSPSGTRKWTFTVDMTQSWTAPDVGTDGVSYNTWNSSVLYGINPSGTQKWRLELGGVNGAPVVSPANHMIVVGGRITYGQPGYFLGVSTSGALLWREELPFENGNWVIPMSRAKFSNDGQTAYVGTTVNDYAVDPYCYLYALDTSGGAIAPPSLSAITVSPTSVQSGFYATGNVSLTRGAPTGGAVVSLSSSNAAAASVPASVTIPTGASSASFNATGGRVATTTTVTLTASYAGVIRTTPLTVTPPPTPALDAVSVNPSSVAGGTSTTGQALLTMAAPAGGAVVSISSSNPAVASVPASVTIASGVWSANFTVGTSAVTANTQVTVTGTYQGVSRSAVLTVTAPAALQSLAVSPTSVAGGTSASGTVTLTGPAGSSGAVVALSSNNPAATVPGSVTVPAGASSVRFTIGTSAVTVNTVATITSSYAGVSRTASLTVTPPPATDRVSVTLARFSSGKLRVEATCSVATATLRVYTTSSGALIGTLTGDGTGRFRGDFTVANNPLQVTVRSSGGGSATANVTQ